MLAIERVVVFKHEHREIGCFLALRVDQNGYGSLPGSDLGTAHAMSRVHRIARQDRDVVVLGRIQNDHARIERRLGGRSPAGAVADVARGSHVRAKGWRQRVGVKHGLSSFARYGRAGRPHAALRHHRHVAGVEVRAENCRSSLCRDGRATGRQRVRLAIGVHVEGAVFLNDPAVVGNRRRLVDAVHHGHGQAAARREYEVRRLRSKRCSLGVLHCEGQNARARRRTGDGKAAIRVRSSRSVTRSRRGNLQRVACGVRAGRQHAGRLDGQGSRHRGGEGGDGAADAARFNRCSAESYGGRNTRRTYRPGNRTVGAIGKHDR